MAGIRITGFGGAIPLRDPRLLPETAASEAVNCRLASGALDGLRRERQLRAKTPDKTHRYAYRIPTGAIGDITAAFWWMFEDADTDVVRTPIVNDSFERYYYASPSQGLKYATKAQILAGTPGTELGVQAPTTPITLDVIAGTGAIVDGKNTGPIITRSYLATFVSEYGEESGPSPTAEVTGPNDADFRLRDIPQPVTQSGKPIVTLIRIYRTITGADGTTTFFKVVEFAPGTTTIIDRASDTVVSGQGELESTLWAPPLPGIQGLALMPNGIMVGWIGNTLYFSENYRPHAWPAEYGLTVQHPIVGLGIFGNTCVVMTEGHPATVTGIEAAQMTLTTSDIPAPCVSRRSIVSTPEGVYYATPQGLALYNPSGMQVITDAGIGRERWQLDYAPSTIDAIMIYGCYTAVRTKAGAKLAFMMPGAAPDAGAQPGLTEIDRVAGDTYVGMDTWSGRAWRLTDGVLYEWLPTDTRRERFRWRSKEFQLPEPRNMGAAQVRFRPVDFVPDTGEDLIRLRVWADEVKVYDQSIVGRSSETIRLPTGFRAEVWQVEVEGALVVHEIVMGGTVDELRKV